MLNWSLEQQQIGAAVMWELWRFRNELVWNNKRSSPDAVIVTARRLIDDWRISVASKEVGKFSSPLPKTLKWTKPDFGKLKLNVDASFMPSTGTFGAGWIL
ncbi:hypothetical protein MANES_06G029901v8 [Manihot esculenta]|uniref:Uncharacterized protein n=1 Tax=Manihot esculenta TaxID=3983 RepID=A0ACB7HJI4_MANES|nr:hypothetical protein MANES_06G029901v8 [Manihot esculenta]